MASEKAGNGPSKEARGQDIKLAVDEAVHPTLVGANSFGPGTMLMTRDGEVPVEWLETGDALLTRDGGYATILEITRNRLSGPYLRRRPEMAPVCIAAGSLANGLPAYDILVAPNQLLLYRSPRASLHFWSIDVLIPAQALASLQASPAKTPPHDLTLTQLRLPSHELLMSEGIWLGSLLEPAQKDDHGDTVARAMQAARPILSMEEARLLLEADTGATGIAGFDARRMSAS
ncbi:MAG: Hint domain-containing protein [Pseudomonadota bacterium]